MDSEDVFVNQFQRFLEEILGLLWGLWSLKTERFWLFSELCRSSQLVGLSWSNYSVGWFKVVSRFQEEVWRRLFVVLVGFGGGS